MSIPMFGTVCIGTEFRRKYVNEADLTENQEENRRTEMSAEGKRRGEEDRDNGRTAETREGRQRHAKED